jgi:hypothetical protein
MAALSPVPAAFLLWVPLSLAMATTTATTAEGMHADEKKNQNQPKPVVP